MANEARLKEALQRICGFHDQKGDFWNAIADAKVLLHEFIQSMCLILSTNGV